MNAERLGEICSAVSSAGVAMLAFKAELLEARAVLEVARDDLTATEDERAIARAMLPLFAASIALAEAAGAELESLTGEPVEAGSAWVR
jgi:hypothetical protein